MQYTPDENSFYVLKREEPEGRTQSTIKLHVSLNEEEAYSIHVLMSPTSIYLSKGRQDIFPR
jgi:hypothetical protein